MVSGNGQPDHGEESASKELRANIAQLLPLSQLKHTALGCSELEQGGTVLLDLPSRSRLDRQVAVCCNGLRGMLDTQTLLLVPTTTTTAVDLSGVRDLETLQVISLGVCGDSNTGSGWFSTVSRHISAGLSVWLHTVSVNSGYAADLGAAVSAVAAD